FFAPYYSPYYYYPYYYPYPAYAPPPPEEPGWGAPPDDEQSGGEESRTAPPPQADDARRATYGLVQLHGVPNGAAVDLDGKFWLTASDLDTRWLALPQGEHRLTVRVADAEPVERRID